MGQIGTGGMAQVRRVHDSRLGLDLAIKILPLAASLEVVSAQRFMVEARLTAQLRHPAVVAVQDLGQLEDGRLWFTMAEVSGTTWLACVSKQSMERRVQVLCEIADAVVYVHAQGVVHRDLKPSNVMIGAFGQVRVLDWGIAQWEGELDATTAQGRLGTPRWMAPEQNRFEGGRVGPAADVYALGQLIAWIQEGVAPDPVLEALAQQASQRDSASRPSGQVVLESLRKWLDDSKRRSLAEEGLAKADVLAPRLAQLREQIDALWEAVNVAKPGVLDHDPLDKKRPLWALEDRAKKLEIDAAVVETEWVKVLQANLSHLPEHAPTKARLAEHYARRLREAERSGQQVEIVRNERFLREHDDGRYGDLLQGLGSFTLVTEVECRASLIRFEEVDRCLVHGARTALGTTPLVEVTVPAGSYLLELLAEGRVPLRIPVCVRRGEHSVDIAPGEQEPYVHPVPVEGIPGMQYIAAGWFEPGGDPDAVDPVRLGRVWVEAFYLATDPVTVEQYLAFVNALPESEARQHVPVAMASVGGKKPVMERVDGRWVYTKAGISLQAPMASVPWTSMCAYVAWRREQTGLALRLPHGVEWEKAARGADGRWFPTGWVLEPTATVMVSSTPNMPTVRPVSELSRDLSPYGVRGMSGNIGDVMGNAWTHQGGRVVAGRLVPDWDLGPEELPEMRRGSFSARAATCRTAMRMAVRQGDQLVNAGFRLVMALRPRPGTIVSVV